MIWVVVVMISVGFFFLISCPLVFYLSDKIESKHEEEKQKNLLRNRFNKLKEEWELKFKEDKLNEEARFIEVKDAVKDVDNWSFICKLEDDTYIEVRTSKILTIHYRDGKFIDMRKSSLDNSTILTEYGIRKTIHLGNETYQLFKIS